MNTTFFLTVTCAALGALLCESLRVRHYQKKVQKHDQVLFPFCQLRRDIINFLHENVVEKPGVLSREDYTSVRQLLDVLNGTIRNYNEHKTLMFDIRKMEKHLRTYRQTADSALAMPDNPEIRDFHERFGRLLVKAFIAYTPLIRRELTLKLIAFAYRAGKQAEERRRAEYVIRNAEKVRDDARHYGHMDDGAVAA